MLARFGGDIGAVPGALLRRGRDAVSAVDALDEEEAAP
jgi:hypothetical protein